jgi:RNA polymerase sigma factor (sigma-70 family)
VCSFNQVLRDYGPALSRVAAAYEADYALREDLVQEILLAIHRALPKLTQGDRLRPFVFRVAHNRGVTHVIRQVRAKRPAEETVASDMASPEDRLLEDERSRRLLAAIRQLPLPYRQVVTLLLEDMSYAEIAETLALTLSNVGVRINRAKAQLRTILDESR